MSDFGCWECKVALPVNLSVIVVKNSQTWHRGFLSEKKTLAIRESGTL